MEGYYRGRGQVARISGLVLSVSAGALGGDAVSTPRGVRSAAPENFEFRHIEYPPCCVPRQTPHGYFCRH